MNVKRKNGKCIYLKLLSMFFFCGNIAYIYIYTVSDYYGNDYKSTATTTTTPRRTHTGHTTRERLHNCFFISLIKYGFCVVFVCVGDRNTFSLILLYLISYIYIYILYSILYSVYNEVLFIIIKGPHHHAFVYK